jgi:hypothetical protein
MCAKNWTSYTRAGRTQALLFSAECETGSGWALRSRVAVAALDQAPLAVDGQPGDMAAVHSMRKPGRSLEDRSPSSKTW